MACPFCRGYMKYNCTIDRGCDGNPFDDSAALLTCDDCNCHLIMGIRTLVRYVSAVLLCQLPSLTAGDDQ